ncbi:MAG: anhydro-N-acetylmuramic acid kinase [Moraxellaceae bacterium]|nr:anhydro-N-acetylmuramic acid kinase [Moraxellaceae bacterium]
MTDNSLFNEFQQGYYIGVMSGTSLDGMDVVLVQFEPKLQLIASHSKNFSPKLKSVLSALCQPNGTAKLDDNSMSELDYFGWASCQYAEFVSQVINELLTNANVSSEEVIAIGCHGQTVRHRPEHAFSLQLLDPNIIAERTEITVVSDFRRRDMAVGGQGAPLVPAFHQAMFADNTNQNPRIILNLGGIANITVLGDTQNQQVIGYDTGPANLLLDAWVWQHLEKPYDKNGDFARSGEIIQPLLAQLLTHNYFAKSAPKSTGREDFHLAWLEEQLAHFTHHQPNIRFSPADVQATLTELTAVSICNEVLKYGTKGELFVCGGGAYNKFLLQRLQTLLNKQGKNWQVSTTEPLGLNPTWVEAIAFAWLAKQTLMGEVANLPAVTGASKAVVLGQVCFA